MPFIAQFVLPLLSYLNFNIAVILSAVLLIFSPIFLLGCTSPLFIRLNAATLDTVGLISGKVYAISTFGGIVSTFLCGFFLIPELGLKNTLLIFSILLFVSGFLTLKTIKPVASILFIAALFVSFKSINETKKHLFNAYGVLGEITVSEFERDGKKIRALQVNKIIQTEMDLASNKSNLPYISIIDSLVEVKKEKAEALVLGLGGGMVANMLCKKNFKVDGVEFDNRIIESAKNYFYLNSNVNAINNDARRYINHCKKKYDLIIFDLFKAEEQPAHIITIESLKTLKQIINPNAVVILNWHGYQTLPLGKGTEILLNTFRSSGFDIDVIPTGPIEDYRNLLIVAHSSNVVDNNSLSLVNTDDCPRIERANAGANIVWRKNYLKYYQSINQ
ncbi:MAG: fused MFS/spermidine synthase [Bacteroidia bacterium]|nr:fused MFS/spermidine synthase [Bacteroidia bacterium]